jgi:hypothetical protein
LDTLALDFHSSTGKDALDLAAVESLRENRIDPKFLYVTPHQAGLWRQVFLRHSPIHDNPEFTRIYQDAFAQIFKGTGQKNIALVGLGCGTGKKELELHAGLKARGTRTVFMAVDVSRELVEESVQKLVAAGASHRRSLVCDLAETQFLAAWLDEVAGDLPRLITFFGLVPNLAPSIVTKLFRSVLRPGDVLLTSVHLAPVDRNAGLSAAMRAVLPQYDNRETLAWLTAALEAWELAELLETPEMEIGEIEGVPAFIGSARWKTSMELERWGSRFFPISGEPLRIFHSLRYTVPLFEALVRREGFRFERLALTACGEEGIWSIRSTQP